MKLTTYLFHSGLVFAVIVGCRFLTRALVPSAQVDDTLSLIWSLASDLVTAAVLAFLGDRSPWSGWRLPLALSAIYSGLQAINAIEAVVYLHISPRLVFVCLGTGVIMLPVWKVIFRQNNSETRESDLIGSRSFGASLSRFLIGSLCYVVLYLIAGIIILPFVREFYATQKMPSMREILGLQIFCRGPLFVALCVLMLHMVSWPRGKAIFTVASAFAVLSGVVPLMVPNPLFPDSIRWVHFCEVTSSNFVFALIVAWIFSASMQPQDEGAARSLSAS